MKNRLVAATFLCCFSAPPLTAALPAQEFVLIVRTGPTDLRLNWRLAQAIANEPQVGKNLREAFGDRLRRFESVHVSEAADQEPGTHQLHFTIDVQFENGVELPGPDPVIDAVRKHVEARIAYLLHEEPNARLEGRRHRLTERLGALMLTQEKLTARTTTLADEIARRRDSMHTVNADVAEARIKAATEERALERLQSVAAEYVQRRNDLHSRMAEINDRLNHMAEELLEFREKLKVTNGKEAATALRDKLKILQDDYDRLEFGKHELNVEDSDVQRMMTSVMEQIPAVTVELERHRARLQSLEAAEKDHHDVAEQLERNRKDLFTSRVKSQGLRLDIDACRDQLKDVHRKLARMQPVRFDVLRPR